MKPDLNTLKTLAADPAIHRLPVCIECLCDSCTPIEVMRRLKGASEHCFLLESAAHEQTRGRYTFLGFNPLFEVTARQGISRIRNMENNETEVIADRPPEEVLRALLQKYRSCPIEGFPSFTGGFAGFFSYEYQCQLEPKLQLVQKRDFDDLDLMFFNDLIVFDDFRQKLLFITGIDADAGNLEEACEKARIRLEHLRQTALEGAKFEFAPLLLHQPLQPEKSQIEYASMVERAREYIRQGDIFQVVLSNPMRARADGSLFDTYRVLRSQNPSPYMFYFSSDQLELAGASPETLVRLHDGLLETFPLAGTRPAGRNAAENIQLEQELLADPKETSEHNMLVDLGRNDLSRACEIGSVQVRDFQKVRHYAALMHISSTVTGRLAAGKDALDALGAILPAGTLSGAPKFRASEIIYELEGNERGVYGGAVGYLDTAGSMDTCIAIRMASLKNGQLCIRSGAGIVLDSQPEREYQECFHKTASLRQALHQAESLQEAL